MARAQKKIARHLPLDASIGKAKPLEHSPCVRRLADRGPDHARHPVSSRWAIVGIPFFAGICTLTTTAAAQPADDEDAHERQSMQRSSPCSNETHARAPRSTASTASTSNAVRSMTLSSHTATGWITNLTTAPHGSSWGSSNSSADRTLPLSPHSKTPKLTGQRMPCPPSISARPSS